MSNAIANPPNMQAQSFDDWALPQHIAFIQEQISFHEKRAIAVSGQEWRSKIHLETAAKFKALIALISDLQKKAEETQRKPPMHGHQLSLNLEDVDGLPEELVKELSISDADRTEFAILTLIEEAGGLLSIDKLLIGLYKKTGEIHKRQYLTNRLYRMVQKGLLFNVPNKKGAYSTEELTADQVEQIINPK